MYKNLSRILFILIILVILFISYLSIFGIKTNKFNELIKTKITQKDDRIDIDLNSVFIKLNIKERSFLLNTNNVKIFINKQSQRIENIDVFIGLVSFLKQDNQIKKIIINSYENDINSLLKFIRAYKINVPALYLENSITSGKIIYNVLLDFRDNNLGLTNISGKIIDANVNILGKEKLRNINFNFDYKSQFLNIFNLNLKYKNIDFKSKKISLVKNKDLINIKGDFKNKINLNLISMLIKQQINNYLDEKTLFDSNSKFEILINNKFKLKDYKLESKINFENTKINLNDLKIKNYIPDFENKIFFNNGKLDLKLSKQNKLKIKFNTKYTLDKKNKPNDFKMNYSYSNLGFKYDFYIDLTENEIILEDINFHKIKNEKIYLNLTLLQNKNAFQTLNLKLFNDQNEFSFNDIKLTKKFKILDFKSVKAKFYNKNDFMNDISISKNNNYIKINSNKFDISSIIEKNLKSSDKDNVLNIFQNLNSSLDINIKQARLDNEHELKNIIGETVIKNNKLDKINLTAKFDKNNKFVYTKNEIDGKKITTIFSDYAKPFVKKFKFIKGFEDGKLDYTSKEIDKNLSISELRIYNFKLQNMPALTKLLSLASLQGIADLATGEGIRFDEFEMFFENSKNLIKISEIYALGPAISILMEGYVEKNQLVSLRGTLVPATTINKTIAKIPLLGEILVGEKAGEGIFGVSFKIKGPPNNLDTRVNPIKTLTPRFITRTLDKIKKTN